MGHLSYLKSKFFFHAQSPRERIQAQDAGLVLDADLLRWTTRSPIKARALRRFADGSAERKLKRAFITEYAAPESIEYPDTQTPKSWQIEDAWHAVTRSPTLIADEAGLGKTIAAILAMNTVLGKALIICPPFLKYNWYDEMERWTHNQRGAIVEASEALDYDSDFFILPDTLLTRADILRKLAKHRFEWVVVDEIHRFKNPDTQRAQMLLGDVEAGHTGLIDFAQRVLLLSGTPTPNGRPIELYPLLKQIAPWVIRNASLEEYGRLFCGARLVRKMGVGLSTWDYTGCSRPTLLNKLLSDKFMIRHLKKDCLKELGPKTRQLIFLDKPKDIYEMEKKLLTDTSMKELSVKNPGELARYRKEVGLSKIDDAVAYISNLLESSGEKVVVGAHHVHVVEELTRRLSPYMPLEVRGGMSANAKAQRVKLFQTDLRYRVMVGNMQALGLGNTLTRAPHYVCVEPDWSHGVNEQMEDRIHRISQDKHVFCHYLVLRNSLDERMLRRALEKESNVQKIMNETKEWNPL